MTYADFEPFRRYFIVELEEYQLLSRLDRVLKSSRIVDWLGRADRALLRNLPFLRKYARSVVATLRLESP